MGSKKSSSNTQVQNKTSNYDNSLAIASGDNSIGRMGSNNKVNITTVSDKVVESAMDFGKSAISSNTDVSKAALDTVGKNSKQGFDFAKQLMGESFEAFGETQERSNATVNKAMAMGAQQTQEAVKSLTGVIERNQIGSASTQAKSMRTMMIVGGGVMIAMFVFSGRRK